MPPISFTRTRRDQRQCSQSTASAPKVVIDLTSDNDERLARSRTTTGPLPSNDRFHSNDLATSDAATGAHPPGEHLCKIKEYEDWSPRTACRLETPPKRSPGSHKGSDRRSVDDSGIVLNDFDHESTESTPGTESRLLGDPQGGNSYNRVADGPFNGSHGEKSGLLGSRETAGPPKSSNRKRERRLSYSSHRPDDCHAEALSDLFAFKKKRPRLETRHGSPGTHAADHGKHRVNETHVAKALPTSLEKPHSAKDVPHRERRDPRVPFEADDEDDEERFGDITQHRKQLNLSRGRAQSVRIRFPEYKSDGDDRVEEEDEEEEEEEIVEEDDDDETGDNETDEPEKNVRPPNTATATPNAYAKATQDTKRMPHVASPATAPTTKSDAQLQHEKQLLEMMGKVREQNKQLLKTKGPALWKPRALHRFVEKPNEASLFDIGPEMPRSPQSHTTKINSVEAPSGGSTPDVAARSQDPIPLRQSILKDLHASRHDSSNNQSRRLPPVPKIPLINGRATGWGAAVSSQGRVRTPPKKSAANASIIKRARKDLKHRNDLRNVLLEEYHYGSIDEEEGEDEQTSEETRKVGEQEGRIFALLMEEDAEHEQAVAAAEDEKQKAAKVEEARKRKFLVSRKLYLKAQRKRGKEPSAKTLEDLDQYDCCENDASTSTPIQAEPRLVATAGPCSTDTAEPAPLTSANLAALSAGDLSLSSSQTRAINVHARNTARGGAVPVTVPNHQDGTVKPPQAKATALARPEADFVRTNLVKPSAGGPISLRELAEKLQAAQQPEHLQMPAAVGLTASNLHTQRPRQEPRNLAIRQGSVNNRSAGQQDTSSRVFDSFYGKPAYQSLSRDLPLLLEEERFLIELREEGKEWNEISQMFESKYSKTCTARRAQKVHAKAKDALRNPQEYVVGVGGRRKRDNRLSAAGRNMTTEIQKLQGYDERPTSGGKCISYEAMVEQYKYLQEQDDEPVLEFVRDASPPTEADMIHCLYQVKRKTWLPGEDEEDVEWKVIGENDYTSLLDAVEALDKEVAVEREGMGIARNPTRMTRANDKRGLPYWYVALPDGFFRIQLERYFRNTHHGELPSSKLGWLRKDYFYVMKRITVVENGRTTSHDRRLPTSYTALDFANQRASFLVLELTYETGATRIDDVQAEKKANQALREQMEERVTELNEEGEMFRDEVWDGDEGGDYEKVEIWVEKDELQGPRNV